MAEKRTCKRCYLTAEFPQIQFDSNGVCNYCNAHMSPEYQEKLKATFKANRQGELKDIAKQIKAASVANKSKYDCIIGASGGFDSTYVIYIAKKIMGLNPLVVKYDNGLGHELANENLRETCRILNVDLRIIPFFKYERAQMAYATKALMNLGLFFSACFSCHYILPSLVYRTAKEENITYMLVSTNIIEDEADIGSHGYKLKTLIFGFFKCGPLEMLKILYYQSLAQLSFIRLKYQFDGFSLRFFRNILSPYPVKPDFIKKVNVSEYLGWDYLAILNTMREELKWKSPLLSKVPLFRWDCHYGGLIDRSCKKVIGIGAHAALCNWFIQTGLVSKKDVAIEIKYLEDNERINQEVRKVYREFNIDKK